MNYLLFTLLLVTVLCVASAPMVSASNWDRNDEPKHNYKKDKNKSGHTDNIKRLDGNSKKICGVQICK